MRYRFMRFPDGKEKAVTLSYDDGKSQDKNLSDIITSHGLKCTFNLVGDGLKMSNTLNADEVKEYILGRGHEIAVHGYFHRAEGSLRPIEGIREVLDNRLELEKKYGIIIRGMAYPDSGVNLMSNGATYESVKNYLSELDIAYARTTKKSEGFYLPEDWHRWNPTAHHNDPKLMELIDEFLKINLSDSYVASRMPRLLYIWGHSYEFHSDNNWDRLEEICSRLSHKEDIWYATNMEIYEYTQAYNSLIYSADGSIIYNPTLYTVWFNIDGITTSISPGETKKLSN